MKITTLRTMAGGDQCADYPTCPGVHDIDTDPENRYVIAKNLTDQGEWAAIESLLLPGEWPGWMPKGFISASSDLFARARRLDHPGLHPDRDYTITTLVADRETLAEFALMIDVDEHLGTIPVHQLQEV